MDSGRHAKQLAKEVAAEIIIDVVSVTKQFTDAGKVLVIVSVLLIHW